MLAQYPPKVITDQFLRFFQVNQAELVWKKLDACFYRRLHHKLINQIKDKEKKLNDSMKDPVKYPVVLEKKKPWDRTVMYPRYQFQSGSLASFPRQFMSWWKKHYQYQGSLVKNVQIQLRPQTNRTLSSFLIRKKPPRHILKL